jgi:YfiH family protein
VRPDPERVRERPADDGGLRRYELAEWRDAYGIVAGVTAQHPAQNFALTGPTASVDPWNRLLDALGRGRLPSVVAGRQVHGAEVAVHEHPAAGVTVGNDVDGHVTSRAGVLLAVTVADCVPIYIADPGRGAVALLHAGWRGIAAGVVERGIETLLAQVDDHAESLVMHCGVSVCGDCYEVGPEVVRAVTGRSVGAPSHLDLRQEVLERAARSGVARLSASEWCAAHDEGIFWSHRASGGNAGRMAAFLGRPMP